MDAPAAAPSAVVVSGGRAVHCGQQRLQAMSVVHMAQSNQPSRQPKPREAASTGTDARGLGLPELLTAEEVAAWLKISVKAVYAKAERGKLPGMAHVGRRLYFFHSELLNWLQQSRVPFIGDIHDGT